MMRSAFTYFIDLAPNCSWRCLFGTAKLQACASHGRAAIPLRIRVAELLGHKAQLDGLVPDDPADLLGLDNQ